MTPEYPAGTYAYFMTIDAAGSNEYPYAVGPTFFGTPATANFDTTADPAPAGTPYTPFDLYVTNVVSGSNATVSMGSATTGDTLSFYYSTTGAGPSTVNGVTLSLSAPVTTLGPFTADAAGIFSFTAAVPGGLSGLTVYMQAVDSNGTTTLSDPGRVIIR